MLAAIVLLSAVAVGESLAVPPGTLPPLATGKGAARGMSFAFEAVRQPRLRSPAATGDGTFVHGGRRAWKLRVRVACLRIDGSRALVGGVVSSSRGRAVPARRGRRITFVVEDGAGKRPDRISAIVRSRRAACGSRTLRLFAVRGDILVST